MESVVETARDTSRVLVVDDEPCIRDALSAALSTEGYAVRTAGEGGEALASFDEWQPQLVITDLRMASMDGIELCRRIRAESMVPIIDTETTEQAIRKMFHKFPPEVLAR